MRPDFPFPETLWALGDQLLLLRTGRKKLLLLPHGVMPEPLLHGLHRQETYRGIFVVTDPAEFIALPQALAEDRIGDLLGYNIPRKPDEPDRALSLVDSEGREILTVMADAATEQDVAQALARMGGDDHRVAHSDPFTVLRERAAWWLHFFDNLNPIQS